MPRSVFPAAAFSAAASIAAALLATGGAALAQNIPEVEPNNTKAQANQALLLSPGATITGSTTGSQTTGSGSITADYFLVSTVPHTKAIYRYRLVNTAGTTHTHFIRGLRQTGGVISTSDQPLTTSSSFTTPVRFVQWYGFGRSEQVYIRVNGISTTTAPYTLTLQEDPVSVIALGSFAPGQFIFNFEQQGHLTNTDSWLYDADFEPIIGAGNDDTDDTNGGSGSGTQSWLTRPLTVPGTYYLAVADFDLCNNLAQPIDDDYRNGSVLDFAGATLCSSEEIDVPLNFQVRSPAGPPYLAVTATKTQPYQVLWYSVIITGGPCPANFNNIGGITVQDIYDFLEAWTRLDTPADFNHSGRVDVQDVYDFLSAWVAGCP